MADYYIDIVNENSEVTRKELKSKKLEKGSCGDPHHRFARIYCDACRHEFLIAYSCKPRPPARPQSRQKFLKRSGASSV